MPAYISKFFGVFECMPLNKLFINILVCSSSRCFRGKRLIFIHESIQHVVVRGLLYIFLYISFIRILKRATYNVWTIATSSFSFYIILSYTHPNLTKFIKKQWMSVSNENAYRLSLIIAPITSKHHNLRV